MNLPNQLTCLRVILTGILVTVVSLGLPSRWGWAFALFVIASITDYFDGAIARQRNLITDFGKLMDPLADKVLVCSAFILLTAEGVVPAFVPIVLITREFLVSGLRMEAASLGQVIAADLFGKIKTVSQMLCLIFQLAIAAWFGPSHLTSGTTAMASQILLAVVVLTTLGSGASYFRSYLRGRQG